MSNMITAQQAYAIAHAEPVNPELDWVYSEIRRISATYGGEVMEYTGSGLEQTPPGHQCSPDASAIIISLHSNGFLLERKPRAGGSVLVIRWHHAGA